jgi:hypothetical protein
MISPPARGEVVRYSGSLGESEGGGQRRRQELGDTVQPLAPMRAAQATFWKTCYGRRLGL